MATGFTQRWKGKVLAQLLGIGSGGMTLYSVSGTPNITPADLASIAGNGLITAYSTQGAVLPNNGVSNISSTGVKSSMTLGLPAAGVTKTLAFTTVSSGIQVVSSTGATFDGTNSVMLSTTPGQVVMRGLSTARWLIESVFPPSTIANSILTLGTST